MAFARGADHLDGDERSIPEIVVPRPNVSFLYRVKDDRLDGEGIRRDDLIIIERGHSPKAGQIALVNIDGRGMLVRVHREGGKFTFDDMPDDYATVELFGIASRVLRLLLP
jgi:DNA polymerase V